MVTVISIAANEVLYRYLADNGRLQSNNILLWNAVNNRINVLVSSLILCCLMFASIGMAYFERIGVIAISIIMLSMSLRILYMSFAGIMDKTPPSHTLEKIRSCAKKIEGVKDILNVKARYIGTFLHVDLTISVGDDLSMKEADGIVRRVEERLIKKIPLTREANVIIA